jgi:hypothetical protein
MSRRRDRLKGLDGLAQWLEAPPNEPPPDAPASVDAGESPPAAEVTSTAGTCAVDGAVDGEAMLAELASAHGELARCQAQDEAKRAIRDAQLERYDALAALVLDVERAAARARGLRERAAAFAAGALGDEARDAARRIAEFAERVVERASHEVVARRAEAERFAGQHDLAPALAARRRAEEAKRLAGALAAAHEALAASRLRKARELLGIAANENPGSPEVASLERMIAQAELEGKARAVEETLAWSEHERVHGQPEPRALIERLVGLDLGGLPLELRKGVFGGWVRACALLCQREGYLEARVTSSPRVGQGVVMARYEPAGPYRVVSALGWPDAPGPGSPVLPGQFGRTRPLW